MEAEQRYKEDILNLRKHREAARERIRILTEEVESVLNTLSVDYGPTLVSWQDLKKMQVGVPMYVNSKVYFIKYLDELNRMGFKTFAEAGGSFGLQTHDCLEEVLILKGNLIDALRKNKVYTVGQTITYLDDQVHKPGCTVDSIYKVVFIKKIPHENHNSK